MPRSAILFARTVAFRYILAILATVALLSACRALSPFIGDGVTYVVLLPLVAFVSWYYGLGPSILTVFLALTGAISEFGLAHSVQVSISVRLSGAFAFLLASTVIVVLGEVRRRDNERLRNSQGELETRVQERTAELDIANRSLQALSARLLHLQDEERRHIARGLHDSIGQMLAALSMNLSGVRADLDCLTRATASVIDSESLIQEMTKEVRTISHLLHPPLLDEAGLPSALRWFVDGFSQRSKISVHLDCPTDFGRLPRDVETAFFRLVQESLTNIHRHSGSPTARVRLLHNAGEAAVIVADDGRGIPMDKLDAMTLPGTAGIGITGMRERVRQLGGTLAIDSNNKGTKITARIPVADLDVKEFSEPETTSSSAA